jgi:hypothetical protein
MWMQAFFLVRRWRGEYSARTQMAASNISGLRWMIESSTQGLIVDLLARRRSPLRGLGFSFIFGSEFQALQS